MDGLIIGTTFVTVTLLFIKIGEWIDRSFTRRYQSQLEWNRLADVKTTYPPNPFGVSMKEMQQALVELGRAMNSDRAYVWEDGPEPEIDTTLKDGSKPSCLPEQLYIDQTRIARNQRRRKERTVEYCPGRDY